MPDSPQHCQVAKLVKHITGINKNCTTQLCFLSQEPYGSQCQQGPSPPHYTSSYTSSSICSDDYRCRNRLTATSSYILLTSTVTSSILVSFPPSATPPASYPPALLVLLFCLCLTVRLSPSMTASSTIHIWRFPYAVFAWSPAAIITSLARAWRIVSLIPTGHIPGLLSSATIRKAIGAQYASQGGGEVSHTFIHIGNNDP